jgi:hypothetical protein
MNPTRAGPTRAALSARRAASRRFPASLSYNLHGHAQPDSDGLARPSPTAFELPVRRASRRTVTARRARRGPRGEDVGPGEPAQGAGVAGVIIVGPAAGGGGAAEAGAAGAGLQGQQLWRKVGPAALQVRVVLERRPLPRRDQAVGPADARLAVGGDGDAGRGEVGVQEAGRVQGGEGGEERAEGRAGARLPARARVIEQGLEALVAWDGPELGVRVACPCLRCRSSQCAWEQGARHARATAFAAGPSQQAHHL